MAPRSVLGCQHPCLLALGLALAILCTIPYAEAGIGEFMNYAFQLPVLELVPGFKSCFQTCYERHGGKVSSKPGDSTQLHTAIIEEFQAAVAPLREMGPLTAAQEEVLHFAVTPDPRGEIGSGVPALSGGMTRVVGMCMVECEDMLGAGDLDVMLKLFVRNRLSMDYVTKATASWVNAVPSEKETREFLARRVYVKSENINEA